MAPVRLAVVQTSPTFGMVKDNVESALEMMSRVEAEVYVLPELFSTGYNFLNADEVEQLSEPSTGETFEAMRRFAKSHSCYIVYGFAERDDYLYNSSALVGPDGLIGLYRKVHLFDREALFFTRGNLGFPVFDLPFGRVGMMICFDWYFPESARSLTLRGAQLIAHPSNLILAHCPDAMVTRCLENRVYAATANRVGREDRGGVDLTYVGKSGIVSPQGIILERLGSEDTGIAVALVNLTDASDKKITSHNDLISQRRPDQYYLLD